ncbi:MAG: carboxysome peptide B [Gammaproteobacteria bacterium]|nr:carboxysome peptide B [Gammaproteobacteria bacterium]
MDIYQADKTLVCTSRVPGLQQTPLRVLRNKMGNKVVATDPVGVCEGNWVFTASGSAARHAAGFEVLTDLTIVGIIDNWQE